MRIWTFFSMLALALTTLFAGERFWLYSQAKQDFGSRVQSLVEAQQLIAANPKAFDTGDSKIQRIDLKPLVRTASQKNGIQLIYLTESEKDLNRGIKEQSVIARAINVPHKNLIAFLVQLEQQGAGTRIKEIRLVPDKHRSGIYKEAECILSYRFPTKINVPGQINAP